MNLDRRQFLKSLLAASVVVSAGMHPAAADNLGKRAPLEGQLGTLDGVRFFVDPLRIDQLRHAVRSASKHAIKPVEGVYAITVNPRQYRDLMSTTARFHCDYRPSRWYWPKANDCAC